MTAIRTALVLAGGAPVEPSAVGPLPEHDLIVAADSGLAQAALLDIAVNHIVGDLDSADPADVAAAIAAGAEVEQHPVDKDATDLELALDLAVRAGAEQIVVVGGGGGRLDHLLGNALLLASPALADRAVEWRVDYQRILVVHRQAEWAGASGDLVSLLAVGGPARGVTTRGLQWPLADATLKTGSTRGISNRMVAASAGVSVRAGTLLAVHGRPS